MICLRADQVPFPLRTNETQSRVTCGHGLVASPVNMAQSVTGLRLGDGQKTEYGSCAAFFSSATF